eukprot:308313-Prymnesium_polylepis.1
MSVGSCSWSTCNASAPPLPDAPRRTGARHPDVEHVDAASHDARLDDAEPEASEQGVPPLQQLPSF